MGETLAAVQAAEQLAVATDPAVRAALEEIVRDEARHAELAWRFVAWAVETGGDRVEEAVADAFATAMKERTAPAPLPELAGAADIAADLAAHGRVGDGVLRAAFDATFDETIAPNVAFLARVGATGRAGADARVHIA